MSSTPLTAGPKTEAPASLGFLQVYLWILSYMKPYLGYLSVLVLCGIAVGGIELIIPKFIQLFIDTLLPNKQTAVFLRLLSGLAFLLAVMIGFMAVRNLVERILREKAARDFRFRIYGKMRQLGFAYFEQNSTGDTLTLMNSDVSAIQDIYRRYIPGMVWKSVFVLISVILMADLSVALTLIMLGSFLLYYLVGPILEKKASYLDQQSRDAYRNLSKQTYDSIAALLEVRAYGAESWMMAEFWRLQKQLLRTWLRTIVYGYSRDSFRRLTYNIGAVFIFIYGVVLVRSGALTVGEFTAFLLFYFNGLLMLTNIVTEITEQKILLIQAGRVYRFYHLEPLLKQPEHPVRLTSVRGSLELRDVSFGYPGRDAVLNNINLRIRPGEKIALVGTSGNGKSTLLKLLDRFYDPTEGEVLLDGIPLSAIHTSDLRAAIGYVFQETYLFGTSVKENIRFGKPDATDEEIVEAAKAAFAHEFIMQLPEGYDTAVGERGVKLSGGQKQRISIARMFIKNPSVVLLDEATSALDQASELEVQIAFERLLHGRTTIAVAHRLSTIRDYDRIAVIEEGTIVEIGSWDELIAWKGKFYTLLEGEKSKEDAHES